MKIVIFIDCQEDFFRGSLANENAIAIIPALVDRAEQAYNNKEMVIFTKDTHYEDYLNTLEGEKLPIKHTIYQSEGWEIIPELKGYATTCIYKYTFGSFDLIDKIRTLLTAMGDSAEIEICGVCTDICVISNCLILRAAFPNTPIIVNSNLCAGTTKENHEATLKVLESCQIEVID